MRRYNICFVLSSWTVECSYNDSTWFEVDEKENSKELKEKGAYHIFKCDKAFIYAKKIRIWCKCTTNSGSVYQLHLSRAEFFGKMDASQCKLPFSINQRYTFKRKYFISPLVSSLSK